MAIGNNLTPLQTTAELKKIKTKIDTIEENAQVNKIETIKVNNTAQTITSKAVNITVPTQTSQLTNNSNFVSDSSYVHTDSNYTSNEKSKLSYTNIAYGTCSTAAATAAKVITITDNSNWDLKAGSIVVVKFTYTNTASNPTFNVNSKGAKNVWYNTSLITTSNLGYAGTANRPMEFIYDGTQFVFIGWSMDNNTTYSNASLGQGYGTCATVEATAAKVVTLSNYALVTGGIVSVKFTYAVPANATLNIDSKGAKSIFYKGSSITANVIGAGDVATFIYDGTQYHLIGLDSIYTSAEKTKLSGITSGATKVESSSTNGNIKINGTETTVYTKPALTKSEVTTALGYTPPTSDTNTTYSLSQDSTDGHKITLTPSSGNATTITIPDNNTTYSAGTGISFNGTTINNSGVRSIAQGSTNGTISVNTGGTSDEVAVKGLAGAAYKGVVTSIDTSANLPTSNAVKTFVEGKGYVTTDTNTTYTLTQDSTDGHKITLTPSTGTATTITIPDNNTTYSDMTAATSSAAGTHGLVPAPGAGKQSSFLRGDGTWVVPTNTTYTFTNGLSNSSGTVSNSGVRSIATGSANGTISVNTNGTSADVSVKGLGSLAYKSSLSAGDVGAIATSAKGAANGVASLDANGLVPTSQLPSYVDDVLEYSAKSDFPTTGETGKIYVDKTTNLTWRWSGTTYVEISPSLALGTTSSTAYRGDYGNTAYTHATDSSRLTTATSSGLYKIASTAQGHIASLTAVTKADITALGIPGSDTNTWTAFKGATSSAAGTAGYINAVPTAGQTGLFFRSDGSWGTPTNTTYTFATGDSNGQIKVTPSGGTASNISVKGLAGAAYKAVDTSISAASTSTNLPTSAAVASFVEGKGYKTTDNNTTYTLTQDSTDGHKITLTPSSGTATTITIPDNNTTYSDATTSTHGLMSTTDKAKMTYTNIAYGTCSTAAATAAKVITISGNTNWSLQAGSIICVKFSVTNTASNPTFNVNSTGAKSVWYNTAVITTGSLAYAGQANRPQFYMYDGTQYVFLGWSLDANDNTVLGYCSTAAGTAAKVVTCTNYNLLANSYLNIIMVYTNTSQTALTLNINGKGAKPIYINGTASSTSNYTLPAGAYLVYYDGTNYYFRTDGKITGSITGDAATVNGLTVQTAVPANAKFTDTNTTYSAGTGISLSGTTFSNSGVRSIAQGTNNGTISVNTGGTSAEVSVKGLAAAAYKGVDTSLTTSSTSTNVPTSKAVAELVSASGGSSVSYTRTLTSGTKIGSITINGTGTDIYAPSDTNYYPTTFAWTNGTTSGPTGSLTGSGMSAVSIGAIPAANGTTASGIVTTGAQTFGGVKTFASAPKLSTNTLTTSGGYTVTIPNAASTMATTSTSQALTNKTYNGYTLAAACAKGVDTSISSGSTSTNLPTSAAVAAMVDAVEACTTQATSIVCTLPDLENS